MIPEETDIAIEDIPKAGKRVHAFLNTSAARVIDADKRDARLEGHIHDLANLLGMHLAEAPGTRGEILGERRHRPPVNLAEAGNDTVGGDLHLVDPKHRPTMLHEHIRFTETCPGRTASQVSRGQ